jgi:hypothetical protein
MSRNQIVPRSRVGGALSRAVVASRRIRGVLRHACWSFAKRHGTNPEGKMTDQLAPSTRHSWTHDGRVVYEWDQTLEEVNVYISVPAGVSAGVLQVTIETGSVSVGIKGNPAYLTHALYAPVVVSESFWTLQDGDESGEKSSTQKAKSLHLQLQKRERGKPWAGAFCGHDTQLPPNEIQNEKQRLMKERFQLEHPGFDFSNADFNGDAPDANAFLGGVGRT